MRKLKHTIEKHGAHDCAICGHEIERLGSRVNMRVTINGCLSAVAMIKETIMLCGDCASKIDAVISAKGGGVVAGLGLKKVVAGATRKKGGN